MDYRSAEEVALRMYSASTALVNSLELCGDDVVRHKVVVNALQRSSQAILRVHAELLNSPRHDPGRVEGYVAGVSDVGRYLKTLEATKEIEAAIERAHEAVAAGMEAFEIIMGRVSDGGEGAQPAPDRGVREIVEDLRAAVSGSNELTEGQKRDAIGYIGAISSLLDMTNPDRRAFGSLIGGLSKLAKSFGSIALSELVKELIKWGVKNLLL